ncbi:MAG: hypothetical protein ACJ74D_10655 [Gaiellaceae bacterium]
MGTSRMNVVRPAFYALAPGGWRDYVTLLHPPYTAWHLSYVVLGAALAPQWRPGILGLALAAFFLGMGVGAHALDELRGRPLQTRIGATMLIALAAVSLLAATAIGVGTALETDLWLLAFVGGGAFIAIAYNLELFGGRFHSTLWFALAWGALPVLATFFAAAHAIRPEAAAAAVFAAVVSWVQRVLSTPVRAMRRREGRLAGTALDAERALRLLSAAMVALAVALVLARVT